MPTDRRPAPGSESASQADSLASNKRERFDRLFRDHNERLLRVLRAKGFTAPEAAELAQEAYVHVLRLEDPARVSLLEAYLFRVAGNLATDRLRQRATRCRIDELVFFEPEASQALSPERAWAARQELALLSQAIEDLPAICQMAFLLVKVEDLSYDEAAKRLSIHPRRVRRYVARALAYGLKILEETEAHGGGSR